MKDSSYKKSKKNYLNKASKGGESQPVEVNDKYAHIEAVQAQPLEVKVYNNNFDRAFRAFRALVQKERILSDYKEAQSFEKPSDKRRRKRNEMKRKRQEMENLNQRPNSGSKKVFKPKSNSKSQSTEQ